MKRKMEIRRDERIRRERDYKRHQKKYVLELKRYEKKLIKRASKDFTIDNTITINGNTYFKGWCLGSSVFYGDYHDFKCIYRNVLGVFVVGFDLLHEIPREFIDSFDSFEIGSFCGYKFYAKKYVRSLSRHYLFNHPRKLEKEIARMIDQTDSIKSKNAYGKLGFQKDNIVILAELEKRFFDNYGKYMMYYENNSYWYGYLTSKLKQMRKNILGTEGSMPFSLYELEDVTKEMEIIVCQRENIEREKLSTNIRQYRKPARESMRQLRALGFVA